MFIQVFMSIKLHFSVGLLWMGSPIIMQGMHMSSKEITMPSLLLSLALAVDKQVYNIGSCTSAYCHTEQSWRQSKQQGCVIHELACIYLLSIYNTNFITCLYLMCVCIL